MYKKYKYNITLILLLVVIGVFLGMTPLLSSLVDTSLNSGLDDSEQTVVDDEQNQMPTGKFVAPSSSAGEFTRINFAFNVLKEGDGFSAVTSQNIIAMGQVQNVYSKSLRSKNEDFVEEWQYANTSFAKNQFLSRYSNGSVVKTNIIENKSKFSGESKHYEEGFADKKQEISASEFFTKFGNFNDFPLTVNSNNSTVSRYDKITDRNNYVITVSFNINRVDTTYLQTFEENGTKGVKFKEISIVFKINKKTGFFSSITKTESFSTNYSGINVNCEASMTINFLKVNTSTKAEIDAKVLKNFR